jgi:two-component system, OmpR family, response regulator RpaB
VSLPVKHPPPNDASRNVTSRNTRLQLATTQDSTTMVVAAPPGGPHMMADEGGSSSGSGKPGSASGSAPAEGNGSEQNSPPKKILIVDDEASIRRILETRFKMLGYDTAVAADGEEALQIYHQFDPDVVILDIMMPKVDGYAVTREIRKHSNTPIIILTALGDVNERVTGLDMGADDYVVKPFSPKELEARVKSILRRLEIAAANAASAIKPDLPSATSSSTLSATSEAHATSSDTGAGSAATAAVTAAKKNQHILQIGNLRIDTQKRQVFRKNERIRLTGMEFNLLELLLSSAGQPFSRGAILQHVWSYPADQKIDTRVVDVHISRLRAKLETDLSNPELILTARGIGYMFQRLD